MIAENLIPTAGKDATTVADSLELLVSELRRPLAALRGALGILESAEHLPGAMDQARRAVARHLGQLAVLVEGLPDLTQWCRGDLYLQKDRIDVVAAVSTAFESCSWAVRASGRTLALQAPDCSVFAVVDRARLQQIVVNLIEYATRCTDTFGAIALVLQASADEIVLRILVRHCDPDPLISEDASESSVVAEGWLSGPLETPLGMSLARDLIGLHGGSLHTQIPAGGGIGSMIVRMPRKT